MQTMTVGTFKKEIGKKGNLQQVLINAYFNLEAWSGKPVYISDKISEITTLTYRRKPVGIIVPDKGSVSASLLAQYEELKRWIRVDAPVISVFNMKGEKIAQLSEPEAVSA